MKLNSILVVGLCRERERGRETETETDRKRERSVCCCRGEWKVNKEIEIVTASWGVGVAWGESLFSEPVITKQRVSVCELESEGFIIIQKPKLRVVLGFSDSESE